MGLLAAAAGHLGGGAPIGGCPVTCQCIQSSMHAGPLLLHDASVRCTLCSCCIRLSALVFVYLYRARRITCSRSITVLQHIQQLTLSISCAEPAASPALSPCVYLPSPQALWCPIKPRPHPLAIVSPGAALQPSSVQTHGPALQPRTTTPSLQLTQAQALVGSLLKPAGPVLMSRQGWQGP